MVATILVCEYLSAMMTHTCFVERVEDWVDQDGLQQLLAQADLVSPSVQMEEVLYAVTSCCLYSDTEIIVNEMYISKGSDQKSLNSQYIRQKTIFHVN